MSETPIDAQNAPQNAPQNTVQTDPQFESPIYRRSRKAYTLECAFEYFITHIVTDSFLAFLLQKLGLSESLIGIISSLISLAFLFEIVSIFIARKVVNLKRTAIIFHTSSQFFFLFLYLIPFFPALAPYRPVIVIACILIAYFGNYLVTNMIYHWGNSYVEPHKRAEFSATKEIISLLGGVVLTIGYGYIMQAFSDKGNDNGWFLFAAGSILIFCACDFTCLMLIKGKKKAPPQNGADVLPVRLILKKVLRNRSFMNVTLLECLYKIAVYFTVGFLGTYKNLLFAVAEVQIINAAGCLIRAAVSHPIGRFSDKYSFSRGILLGLLITAVGFACNIFANEQLPFMIIIFTVLYHVGCGAIGQNMLNMTYNYIDQKYFVEASAIKQSLSGIAGFLSALVAGKVMETFPVEGREFLGFHVHGQQVLSAVSLLLLLIACLFNYLVIDKQKRMLQ